MPKDSLKMNYLLIKKFELKYIYEYKKICILNTTEIAVPDEV